MAKNRCFSGSRVYQCRCKRGSFYLVANESPKRKRCPQCLKREQAAIVKRVLRLALTRGERRMVRRLGRLTNEIVTQVIRQGV